MRLLCFLVACTNLMLGGLTLEMRQQTEAAERLADVATAQLCVNHPTHALCGGAP